MTELEHVSVEKDDGTAIVVIDRQDKLNALNSKVLQELEGVFTDLAQDENLLGVILIGRGSKAFVAGADIEEMADLNRQSWSSQSEEGQRIFTLIENFRTPVLAAVNGYALGGGCELALACHLRVASTNAKFGFPEVGLGIIPGFGGTVRLSRVVGFGRAIEMVLTGDMITAGRAEHFGLISAVFEPDELLSRSKDFLGSITRHSPQAIQKAIQSLYFAQDSRALESFMMENDLFGQLIGTEEMKEGVSAFLEKRKPVFKGV